MASGRVAGTRLLLSPPPPTPGVGHLVLGPLRGLLPRNIHYTVLRIEYFTTGHPGFFEKGPSLRFLSEGLRTVGSCSQF